MIILTCTSLASETENFPETRADDESRDRGESSAELGISNFADGEPVKHNSCVTLLKTEMGSKYTVNFNIKQYFRLMLWYHYLKSQECFLNFHTRASSLVKLI